MTINLNNIETSGQKLARWQTRLEETLGSLEEIDVDALDMEKLRKLVNNLKTELLRQRDDLRDARMLDGKVCAVRTKSSAGSQEEDREGKDLGRKTAALVKSGIDLADETYVISTVLAALPTGVAITNACGKIILANKALEDTWGKPLPATDSSEDFAYFKAWWGDTDSPVAPGEWAAAIAVQKETTTLRQIIRIRRFDGAIRYIQNSAAPLYDGEGNLIGSAVTTEDITEPHRLQQVLHEREQQLRLFIEHAPVALAVFDREMCYLGASSRWVADIGMEGRDLVGLSAYAIHDVPERWKEAHRRGLAGEVLSEDEDSYRRFDGSIRWIRWKIHPWYTAAGRVGGIIVFSEDITERKNNEVQMRILNEELAQRVESRTRELEETQVNFLHTQKLSTIGRLSASIFHDFSSPLQSILNVLKGVKVQVAEDDSKMVELAIGEAQRLKQLLANLRDFNRPTTGQKTSTDIHLIINDLLQLCKSSFRKKRLSVTYEPAAELPKIQAIADQIKQVVLNLLTNAADACQPGGKILVRTRREKDGIAVTVTDNGVGIEPEILDRIFQPFYSQKMNDGGTGLGLSICSAIVKDHKGDIQVTSRPGEGSTFTVILPACEE